MVPIVALLCLLMSSLTVHAANYWVSATLGTPGTCANAQGTTPPLFYLTTIAAGVACLNANDTLTIRSGTYPLTSTIELRSTENGSTIQGYQSEFPVILATLGNSPNAMVNMEGVSNFTFRDFVLDGNLGMTCTEPDYGGPGACYGVFILNGGSVIVFDNMEMRNLRLNHIVLHSSQNGSNLIRNNRFFGVGIILESLYIQNSNNIIENNRFENHAGAGPNLRTGSEGGVSGNIIRGNIIRNLVDDPVEPGSGGFGIFMSHAAEPGILPPHDNLIYNNVISGTSWDGMNLGGNGPNNRVFNNVIYGSPGGCGITTFMNVEARNNIFYNNIGCRYPLQDVCGNICGNLLPVGTNLSGSAPANFFQNPLAGDFHLTEFATSAIDQGAALAGVFNFDAENVTRPQRLAWDIGPYELRPAPPPPQPDPELLLVYLPLNQSSGTNAPDMAGPEANNGTLSSPAWGPGIIGSGAFQPTGTQSITITNLTGLSITTSCSLNAWINMTATDTQGCAWMSNREACSGYIRPTGELECWVYDGANYRFARGSASVLDGQNHMLTCTYDQNDPAGPGIRASVDNAQVAFTPLSVPISYAHAAGAFRIGQDGADFGGFRCIGRIDEARLYQGRLSDTARANLFEEFVPLAGVSGIHTRWRADSAGQPLQGDEDTPLSWNLQQNLIIEWDITNNSGAVVTDHCPLYCAGSRNGFTYIETTAAPNALGLAVATTPNATMGDLVPVNNAFGLTPVSGRMVAGPTINKSATTAIPHGGITTWRWALDHNAPAAAGDTYRCKPFRDLGAAADAALDHYFDDIEASIPLVTLTEPPPFAGGGFVGGSFTGGVYR